MADEKNSDIEKDVPAEVAIPSSASLPVEVALELPPPPPPNVDVMRHLTDARDTAKEVKKYTPRNMAKNTVSAGIGGAINAADKLRNALRAPAEETPE